MSKMKKIVSVVLAMVILAGFMIPVSAFTVADDVADTVYADAAATLGALGIMVGDDTGAFRPEDTVSRAEFAKIAVHALGLEDVAETSKGVSRFPDVATSHWANGYINVASSQKIIIGDENGNYNPDKGISYQEAITILVRVLGYEPVAVVKGSYPTGYLVQASEIGLTKKANATATAAASRGITAQLTYNALTIKLMEAVGYGSDITYEVVDKTLLSDKLGVEKNTGVVTGNAVTRLDGPSSLNDDQVEIDSKDVFYVGKSKADRLLGYQIEYYVKTDDNDDDIIILAQPEGSKNTILTINVSDLSQDITEDAKSIFYYPEEDSKETELVLSDKYSVIYNDKSAGKLSNPVTGTITLLETTRDDKYDVIFINEYVNYVIDDVSTVSKKVYDKYDQTPLDLDTTKNKNLKVFLEDLEGNEVSIDDLKEWDVLSVFQNTNYIRAVVSTDAVDGKIEERSQSEEKVTINGKEYEIAENIDYADMTLELEGEFYLDMNGKIAGYNAVARKGSNYAYLINAGMTDNFNTELSLKLYTSDGELKTIKTSDKVKIDNKTGYNAQDALKELLGGKETITPTIITYGLNSSGEINLIDRADDKTGNFPESFGNDLFALNYKGDGLVYKETSKKLNIVNDNGVVTGSIGVDKDTLIFSIEEGETSSDNMEINSLDLFTDGNSYNVYVYDMTENMTAKVIRVTNSTNVGKIESPIAVVDRITTTVNSDGTNIDKLYAMVDGKQIVVTTEDTNTLEKEDGKKLEAGDIIQYTTNAKGELDKFTLLFEMSKKGTEFSKNYGSDNEMVTLYGKITKKFSNSINISVNGGTAINYLTNDATVYKFNDSKASNKTSVVGAGELTKWEDESNEVRVFVRVYKDQVKEILIVE